MSMVFEFNGFNSILEFNVTDSSSFSPVVTEIDEEPRI